MNNNNSVILAINNNPLVLFTSESPCAYCDKAKEFLNRQGICFYEYTLNFDGQEYKDLVDFSAQTTVPNIYVNQVHVGGYDKLLEHTKDNPLSTELSFTEDF
jgi:glutaredoxin 3